MSEHKEGSLPKENPQEKLKDDLLNGRISPADFVDRVMELDQATTTRDQAEINVRLLTDPSVLKAFEQDEESTFEFNNLLSLSYFHVGQRKLLSGDMEAKSDFEKALAAAEKIGDESYEQWRHYIRATIAYLDKDIPKLERIAGQMEDNRNKNIVLNMISGLRQYGEIDYRRDYKNIQSKQ